ncbi:MAG: archaetidylserine decarboxylase [Mariprofundus sp.]|nr:archaetidylserine decarboxylase [Mariprofundus sp.]
MNFLLTNRIPRRWLTQLTGWFSRIENPILTRISIALWRLFAHDLDLSEARKQSFNSLHECFIRELKPGVRPIDRRESIIVSPCDAIIGAHGKIEGTTVYQAKGFPYRLGDLIPDESFRKKYRDGLFVTLRLKSSMYHRFHAPVDCRVHEVNYISGDTWNVNPIALKRIEKLYCKNERAVLQLDTGNPEYTITLVPVAAILVASMKFHCLDGEMDLRSRGSNYLSCRASYSKGDEMGYFQHGSTIIMFATSHYVFCDDIQEGQDIKMGESLIAS